MEGNSCVKSNSAMEVLDGDLCGQPVCFICLPQFVWRRSCRTNICAHSGAQPLCAAMPPPPAAPCRLAPAVSWGGFCVRALVFWCFVHARTCLCVFSWLSPRETSKNVEKPRKPRHSAAGFASFWLFSQNTDRVRQNKLRASQTHHIARATALV